MSKKAGKLVEKIVVANTPEAAIAVLKEVMSELYLDDDYVYLVHLTDKLNEYEKDYKEILNKFKTLETPRSYEAISETRLALNFLYVQIVDELSFDICRVMTSYKERKTVQRAESMITLKNSKEFQDEFKTKSSSLIREMIGMDEKYDNFTLCTSVSYGLYKKLEFLLTALRMLTDSIASEAKKALLIAQKDTK